ncbi:MAG TPA: NADPH-dependent F420 reductase [Anaerolineae bacterium]|nr:NADPH-dependent F420 reductase [Anaerolineae bacterium]
MTLKIAVIGGTGKEGKGLALRWANAGHEIIIGSRDAERAATAANELNTILGKTNVSGLSNADAARAADIVVLSVPYEAHAATLDMIADGAQSKILIDVTAPLDPENKKKTLHVPEGSAAQASQQRLGSNVRVVAAFQNISYTHLTDLHESLGCDVLVCGNDKEAKKQVIELAKAAGMAAFDAGPIENAVVAEGLTAVLININIAFKIKNAGIRITGVPQS